MILETGAPSSRPEQARQRMRSGGILCPIVISAGAPLHGMGSLDYAPFGRSARDDCVTAPDTRTVPDTADHRSDPDATHTHCRHRSRPTLNWAWTWISEDRSRGDARSGRVAGRTGRGSFFDHRNPRRSLRRPSGRQGTHRTKRPLPQP